MIAQNRVGAINVFSPSLPLTKDASEALRDEGMKCITLGNSQLVIDLQNVPVMDSRALEAMLDIQDACLRRGGALKLAGATPIVTDILHATGLDEMIEVYQSSVNAVGSYSG